MVAVAPAPVVDPYISRLHGDAPRNSLGGHANERYLGTELDLGLRARYGVRNVWLQAGLQTGVLFPGRALADQHGTTEGPVWGVWFRTEIRY